MTDHQKVGILTEALRRITEFALEPGMDPLPLLHELQQIAEDALEQVSRDL